MRREVEDSYVIRVLDCVAASLKRVAAVRRASSSPVQCNPQVGRVSKHLDIQLSHALPTPIAPFTYCNLHSEHSATCLPFVAVIHPSTISDPTESSARRA